MPDRQNPALTEVFLRIEHDTAEPTTVTAALGLTPTHVGRCGQQAVGGKGEPYPWNVWVLSSAWSVQSKNVGDHFRWLLTSIGSRGAALRTLRGQGHRIAVHCLWVGKGGYGGPELSPDIMRGLADMEVEVYFDVAQFEQGTATSQCNAEVIG